MEKTFLLCVGAQKSGTTWLSKYLDSHPNADMGFLKEYHVFDALYMRDKEITDKYLRARLARFMRTSPDTNSLAALKHVVKLMMTRFGYIYQDYMALRFIANANLYFDYFAERINPSKEINLTGDISPSYAGLPIEAFNTIREGFESRGIKTKVVFIMRDPVDRCVSAVRHRLRNQRNVFTLEDEIEMVKQNYASSAFMFRTQYERTISTLEAAFDPTDIKYFFYENFFNDSATNELCRHLSLEFKSGNYGRRENVSNTSRALPDDLLRSVFLHYRGTYAAISRKFGEDSLPSLWKSYGRDG